MVTSSLLNQALQFHQQGKLAAAEEIYKSLLIEFPNNEEILHLAAILYGQNNQLDMARTLINRALKIQQHDASFFVTSGNIARREHNYELAQTHFEKAIELKPNNATAIHNLAILAIHQKQFDRAVPLLEQAIAIKPNYSDAYLNLGTTLIKINRLDQAFATFKKGCDIDSLHPDLWVNLGQLHQQRQEFDAALSCYLKVLELNPKEAQIHYLLGTVYAQQDQLNQAFDEFVMTLKLDDKHIEAMHNVASILFKEGEYQKALRYWLKLLSQQQDSDTYYNIGVCYSNLGRFDEAVPFFNETIKYSPKHTSAMVNLASILIKQGNTKKALKLYHQVLSIEPHHEQVKFVVSALEQQDTPSSNRAPDDYVIHLFNQYAPHFEQHLEKQLSYRAPELIAQALERHVTEFEQPNILDLGCGTGLCGVKLKPLARKLVGVDLSDQMLKVAAKKNIYDHLAECEIIDYLGKNISFDIVVAGDVLPYFGDLTPILARTFNAVNKEGVFVFTVEKSTQEKPFHLAPSARFKHNIEILLNQAMQIGWQILEHETVITRTQQHQPVHSALIVLIKK